MSEPIFIELDAMKYKLSKHYKELPLLWRLNHKISDYYGKIIDLIDDWERNRLDHEHAAELVIEINTHLKENGYE